MFSCTNFPFEIFDINFFLAKWMEPKGQFLIVGCYITLLRGVMQKRKPSQIPKLERKV